MAVRSFSGVRASEVNPSFLHANSTSHTWIFSAFAELIDNAYDPDVAATQLWIEKRMINGQVTLVFVDNGNGMTPDRLHKMLSFGFSEKIEIRGHRPIGQYGNGFKSGSMRLGKDVLVFTRQKGTMSVGFLSQSYLQSINAKTVFVPIVTWRLPSNQMVQTQECYSSLKEILRHSIFRTERSIIQELDALGCIGHSGTEIIIYNLKRDRRGNLELDFESDPNDILNPQTLEMDRTMMFRPVAEPTPAFRRSLREYCSILYLKPRMKIMLRGEKVKTKLVSRSLSRTEKDVYKPHFLTRPVKIIFGFSPSKVEDYGILMYHKNRLIIAYEKVGYQKQANELGVGCVGVVELNFLEPIHNKQDFNKTSQYNSCVNALGVKLNEYWNEKTKGITPGSRLMGPGSRPPDWLWAQCDKCLKWRRLPPTISENQLPKKWFCHMNHDATRNRCDIPEESEEDDDMMMRPSYEKTYKKQMEERKRQQRFEQMRQMQNREKQLAMKEEELKKMRMMSMQGGATNNTPGQPTPPANPQSTQQTDAQPVDIDVKPDEADLMRAQQELTDAKRRETQQTKLIEQLQQQKDMLEKKQRDVLKIAESITIKQIQDTEKNGPNQSLEFGGVKRPLEGEGNEEGDSKRTRVVTSDGEVVYVVQGDQAPKPIIDLTLSDDEEQPAQDGQTDQPSTNQTETNTLSQTNNQASVERDIKPDLDELDRRIAEAQRALGMVDEAAEGEKTDSAGAANMDGTASTTSETNSQLAGATSEAGLSETSAEAGQESAPTGDKDAVEGAKSDETLMKTQTDSIASEAKDKSVEEGGTTESESDLLRPKDEPLDEMEEDFGDDDFGGDFAEDDDDDDEILRDLQTPEVPGLQAIKASEGSSKDGQQEDAKSTQEESTENRPEQDMETSGENTPAVEDNGDKSPKPCNTEQASKESEDEKAKLAPESDGKALSTCKSEDSSKTDIKDIDTKTLVNKMKDEKLSTLTNGDLTLAKAGNLDMKPKMSKVVKTRGVQTLPVEIKGLLAESLNFSKLAPSEIHHLLVQRTNELESLRKNIRELLRIILPEVDMGTPDCIDQVVQEVIRVNQVDSENNAESKNNTENADNTETSEAAESLAVEPSQEESECLTDKVPPALLSN